eukprot:scaffold243743_cov34-Tisochrysis_lutea.AAC.1
MGGEVEEKCIKSVTQTKVNFELGMRDSSNVKTPPQGEQGEYMTNINLLYAHKKPTQIVPCIGQRTHAHESVWHVRVEGSCSHQYGTSGWRARARVKTQDGGKRQTSVCPCSVLRPKLTAPLLLAASY